ncbi:MAG: DUF169 domain-containing protein [Desulfatibacillaceae bacterium]|nr:DUF169 domain-containing protein [Desulfatibacillaceae bacterium]
MKTLEDFQKAGKELFARLHLSTWPVAIRYITDEKEIPQGAMRPSVFNKKMALCQAFTQARQWGSTVAMTAADNFCVPSSAMHQWAGLTQEDLIQSQFLQGWHKNEEAERRRFAAANALIAKGEEKMKGANGLVCAPLEKTPVLPHSVLVYCNGVQITHIIQALSYEHLHVPESRFEGFEESCVKGGLLPFVTGIPQVVIPGMGDRSFAGIQDHELAIGMPADLVFYTLENLFKTGGPMNIGYPAKTMLAMHLDENLTPGFKFLWNKIK